jgi:hypothetical protein
VVAAPALLPLLLLQLLRGVVSCLLAGGVGFLSGKVCCREGFAACMAAAGLGLGLLCWPVGAAGIDEAVSQNINH